MSCHSDTTHIPCTVCHGEGKLDNLSPIDRSGFTDDEWRLYLDGGQQVTCPLCVGAGSLRVEDDGRVAIPLSAINHFQDMSRYVDDVLQTMAVPPTLMGYPVRISLGTAARSAT